MLRTCRPLSVAAVALNHIWLPAQCSAMATPRGLDRRPEELKFQLTSWCACRVQEAPKFAGQTAAQPKAALYALPASAGLGSRHLTSSEPVQSSHTSYPVLASDGSPLHPKSETAQGVEHSSGVRSSASHNLVLQGGSSSAPDYKQPKAPQSSASSAQHTPISTALQRVVACLPCCLAHACA